MKILAMQFEGLVRAFGLKSDRKVFKKMLDTSKFSPKEIEEFSKVKVTKTELKKMNTSFAEKFLIRTMNDANNLQAVLCEVSNFSMGIVAPFLSFYSDEILALISQARESYLKEVATSTVESFERELSTEIEYDESMFNEKMINSQILVDSNLKERMERVQIIECFFKKATVINILNTSNLNLSEMATNAFATIGVTNPSTIQSLVDRIQDDMPSEFPYMFTPKGSSIETSMYYKDIDSIARYAKKISPEKFREITSKYYEQMVSTCSNFYVQAYRAKKYYDKNPTRQEILDQGISSSDFKRFFVNAKLAFSLSRVFVPEELIENYTPEELWNKEISNRAKKEIKECQRLYISSMGQGGVSEDLNTLLFMAKVNGGRVFLMPVKHTVHKLDPKILRMHLQGELTVLFESMKINSNLYLDCLEIKGTARRPLNGLDSYRGGKFKRNHDMRDNPSIIIAGTKQILKSIATGGTRHARVSYTPGAITKPFYPSKTYMKSKANALATEEHFMGALVVEKDVRDTFHVRQLMFQDNFSCVDMGIRYFQDRAETTNAQCVVYGDIHSDDLDRKALKLFTDLAVSLDTKESVIQDIYDAASTNPHEAKNQTKKMATALEGKAHAKDELQLLRDDLNFFGKRYEKTYIPYSNHDDMFTRAFNSNEINNNPFNAILASILMPMAINTNLRHHYSSEQILEQWSKGTGISKKVLKRQYPFLDSKKQLLQYVMEDLFELKNPGKFKWFELYSEHRIGGYNVAVHGDKGANGARGSHQANCKIDKKQISGHTHVAAQMNHNISVGHLHQVEGGVGPQYALGGASSWMQTCVYIYETGEAQLITNINGRLQNNVGRLTPQNFKSTYKKRMKSLQA
jgi:hypothetical protein